MIPAPHEIDFIEKQKTKQNTREQPSIQILPPEEEQEIEEDQENEQVINL